MCCDQVLQLNNISIGMYTLTNRNKIYDQMWILPRSFVKGNINAVEVIAFVREHVEERKEKRHATSCGTPKKLKVDVGDDSE